MTCKVRGAATGARVFSLETAAELQAVHIGHSDVEEDEIGGMLGAGGKREGGTREAADGIATVAQNGFEQREVGGMVVDQVETGCVRDFRGGAGCFGPGWGGVWDGGEV
jgi:hypothetical protein